MGTNTPVPSLLTNQRAIPILSVTPIGQPRQDIDRVVSKLQFTSCLMNLRLLSVELQHSDKYSNHMNILQFYYNKFFFYNRCLIVCILYSLFDIPFLQILFSLFLLRLWHSKTQTSFTCFELSQLSPSCSQGKLLYCHWLGQSKGKPGNDDGLLFSSALPRLFNFLLKHWYPSAGRIRCETGFGQGGHWKDNTASQAHL